MRDYTYQDMLKMQEDAAKRVREMKKRAAIAVEEDVVPSPIKRNLPDEVKRISYPVELPEPDMTDDAIEPVIEKNEGRGILKMLTEDKDAMLILALILIVSQDSSDYMTSLSLLYLLL